MFRQLVIASSWVGVFLAAEISRRSATSAAERPNILVVVADDLGWADTGFQGCRDIPTPQLDALASRGLRCTNGYVTHPFCSPTRAGLLTGRYQQRFGHENNPAWLPESTVAGLPITETTLPQVLQSGGYATACVGKWHLGAHPQFHPNRRGFEHYFGLLGGGHVYLSDQKGGPEYLIPLDRNGQPEPMVGYLTTQLGNEAAEYVRRRHERPWFLYLTFNAPHTPLQYTSELFERVSNVTDETRRKYAALVLGMDDALGSVVGALRETKQLDNTLIFFVSDNGGPTNATRASNAPLRGQKGQVYEGGVRVPFVVSWPARLPAGRDFAEPVHTLDIFATVAGLTGAQVPAMHRLEGVDLMPYLEGAKAGSPHDYLFWRTGGGTHGAVRAGRHKLVFGPNGTDELYDLEADVGESRDLATTEPATTARLRQAYDAWNANNIAPLFDSPRPKPAGKQKAS